MSKGLHLSQPPSLVTLGPSNHHHVTVIMGSRRCPKEVKATPGGGQHRVHHALHWRNGL